MDQKMYLLSMTAPIRDVVAFANFSIARVGTFADFQQEPASSLNPNPINVIRRWDTPSRS